MARFLKDRSQAKGQMPGSMILIGKKKLENPVIRVMHYDASEVIEKEPENIEDAFKLINNKSVTWINIYGIHDIHLMENIRDLFGLSPLFAEDMMNTDQMPKYEDGDNYDGFILKMLSLPKNEQKVHSEQLSLILGENYVLTLQEKIGDLFQPVRERIRNNKAKVRLLQNDYLAYALMDTLVDNYLHLTELLGAQIENNEEKIFTSQDDKIAEEIYRHKTELSYFRKNIRPMKEIMLHVFKSENPAFSKENMDFLKDLNELILQATETIELYSNMVSDQLNTYNTITGNRMNQVMKVLTVFASIFIPLTFFAGIYGMNFNYIPELQYKYGYFIFWGFIIIIGLGLLYYFKKKKWL